jgi:hypothetical protein
LPLAEPVRPPGHRLGTIGIAWTVIVGIHGMNVTHLPELDWNSATRPCSD